MVVTAPASLRTAILPVESTNTPTIDALLVRSFTRLTLFTPWLITLTRARTYSSFAAEKVRFAKTAGPVEVARAAQEPVKTSCCCAVIPVAAV